MTHSPRFPLRRGIPYSIAEDSIGFGFSLRDGVHYGYVTTSGTEVLSIRLQQYAPIGAGAPEPATSIMLIGSRVT
jgi:hypothetical protein